VTFVYQDGRSQVVATYTGVSSNGKLTMHLDTQHTLSGAFSARQFTLSGCQAALRWAVDPQQCVFSYTG
jgi:hypothetical protein